MPREEAWYSPYPSATRYWVMQLHERGMNNADVAKQLSITRQAVQSHIIREARRQFLLKVITCE